MDKQLYENLTTEDKINLLHYERGATALVQLERYQGTQENPSPIPKPSNLYISNVLDIDFDEFYNDKANMDKSQLYKDEVKELAVPMSPSGYRSIFIGDALKDVLFIMTHADDARIINEKLVDEIDKELKRIHNGFMELGVRYEPIEGLVVGGHQAYRRIK